ncbi:protein nrt1/ ptr family 5.10 [Phtheirospermum japonicum]|uniref:Protein nrt1/ ptr family 5.10 n=1 Tax=Phtheirospermum japonicum TaxID=374723 RepID=A0A830CHH5_9LAMI|nr:protein nrt1/ ptr family 5.10 [Phtheirospermum japonicum]
MTLATSTITATGSDISEVEAPLLYDVVGSSVDFKGCPADRPKTGCWKSASFIIGVEMAERFAYYGISSNLVSYLTGPLGQSTAAAAANVNAWSGTAFLSPLVGAFIADSYLGKYRTVIIASLLYILGLGFLSLSAALDHSNKARSPPQSQIIFFFCSLYLVALAQGGHKPCLQAFGAEQFDESDEDECKAKSSFFNWWNFCLCASVVVGLLVLSYIQDNMSWELGFGIPCIVMCVALIVFLLGSVTYRFHVHGDHRKNPFLRVSRVFVDAAKNWRRFLDKPLLEPNGSKDAVCSIVDIEDAKTILRLLPICFTCLAYSIIYSQSSTLFTKQGATMDRHITTSFQIPAAALQSFTAASLVLFIPIYERVLVPVARAVSRKPSGISMLQRIGTGIFLSVISMVVAGFIENKRLATAVEYGLVDSPEATVPMSVWWLAPQYLVLGIADVFTLVGIQEFVYDQIPSDLKSMGLALCLGIVGTGSFLSSFLVSVIDRATAGRDGGDSWFSNNLNRAHLDCFYWVLAGLGAFSCVLFVYFARSYVYVRRSGV